jgi:hypothetical protein
MPSLSSSFSSSLKYITRDGRCGAVSTNKLTIGITQKLAKKQSSTPSFNQLTIPRAGPQPLGQGFWFGLRCGRRLRPGSGLQGEPPSKGGGKDMGGGGEDEERDDFTREDKEA